MAPNNGGVWKSDNFRRLGPDLGWHQCAHRRRYRSVLYGVRARRIARDAVRAARYARTNGELTRLLDVVQGADAAPTVAAEQTANGILEALATGRIGAVELNHADEP